MQFCDSLSHDTDVVVVVRQDQATKIYFGWKLLINDKQIEID